MGSDFNGRVGVVTPLIPRAGIGLNRQAQGAANQPGQAGAVMRLAMRDDPRTFGQSQRSQLSANLLKGAQSQLALGIHNLCPFVVNGTWYVAIAGG